MVDKDPEPVHLRGQAQQRGPEQRAGRQVEGAEALGHEPLLHDLLAPLGRAAGGVVEWHVEADLREDHLDRLRLAGGWEDQA